MSNSKNLTLFASGDNEISFDELTVSAETPQIDLLKTSSTDVLANIRAETDAGTGGKLVFQTKRDGDTALDRVVIDDDGNVGVGTSSPSTYAKFAIRGGLTVNAGSTSLTGVSFSASDAANSTFWITHASATTNLITDAPMAFYTASGSGVAERMRIDSNGNVGIGESSPTAGVKLHVTNALQVNQYLESTGNTTNSILQTGADGNSAYVFNRANAALTFGTNNTERMRIDSQGRVGIKTDNPTSLLHIFDGEGGTSAQTDLLTLQTQRSDFGSGGSSILFFDTETPPATSGGNASSRGRIKAYTENADEFQTDFRFSLSDRSDSSITSISADATTITVIHTASVGLGVEVGDYVSIQSTTNFNEDFAVTGVDSNTQFTIAATGYEGFAEETSGNVAKSETFDRMVITGGGNVGIGIDSPSTDALHVVASGLDDDDDTIVLGANFSSASTLGSIGTHHEDVNNGGLKFSSKTAGTLTEAMRIDASGNVGINTSSPASIGGGAKLTVDQAADGNIVFARGGSTRQVQLGTTSTTGYINADNTSGGLTFNVNASERMRIDASGNVGIGTSDIQHDAKLDISILDETYTNAHTALRLGSRTSLGVNEAALTFVVTGQALAGTIFSNYGYDNTVAYQENPIRPSGYISFSNGLPNTGTGRIIFGGSQIGSTTLVEHAQFNPSGNLQFADGKGIDFSALTSPATSGTATGNVLNDYEEGTFTPTYITSGTAFTAVGYDTPGGRYTKIGNVVHIQAFISTDSIDKGSASGNILIGGLPFNAISNNLVDGFAGITISDVQDFAVNQPEVLQIAAGQNYGELLYRSTSNGPILNMQVSDMGTGLNSNICYISGTYLSA